MPVNPVSPKSGGDNPHAGKVEAVAGMDETVRAGASGSEEVAEGSEDAAEESREVQGEEVEASRTDQEEDAETQAPRAARAPHTPSQREMTSTTRHIVRTDHGATPACEVRPKTIVT